SAGKTLQRVEDPQVEGPPLLVKEARIGDVVSKDVLEGLLEAGKECGLVQDLGRLEQSQPRPQRVVVDIGDRLEKNERNVLADDGGGLEQALLIGLEAVD